MNTAEDKPEEINFQGKLVVRIGENFYLPGGNSWKLNPERDDWGTGFIGILKLRKGSDDFCFSCFDDGRVIPPTFEGKKLRVEYLTGSEHQVPWFPHIIAES